MSRNITIIVIILIIVVLAAYLVWLRERVQKRCEIQGIGDTCIYAR